ncbi:MAG: membrane protein [Thermodesulfobacteriota bacterium]|nr:MAG: membrane protein [Thermodesulfobacteriota bacterium]
MVFRSVNAVLSHPIMEDLSLNHLQIGFITSTFVLAFAIFQIPLGLIVDSWGARKTQVSLFIIAAVASVLFGLSSSETWLSITRALLGIGMAGSFICAVKAITDRVESEKIPYYTGIILAFGGVGALLATTPAKLFQIDFGWRNLCYLLGLMTFLIAVLIFVINKDDKVGNEKESLSGNVKGLISIYKNGFFWRISPLLIFSLGGFIAMQGLWLGPWLHRVVDLTHLQSANYLLVIAVSMIFGFLSGGLFSKIASRLGLSLATIVVIGIGIHILTQFVIILNILTLHYLIWFIFGYFAQVTLVNYSILAQHFGPKISGRALTAANILVFLFAFVVQYLFGVVVHYWPRMTGSDIAEGFKVGLSALVALELIALIWYVVYRPSSPKS